MTYILNTWNDFDQQNIEWAEEGLNIKKISHDTVNIYITNEIILNPLSSLLQNLFDC